VDALEAREGCVCLRVRVQPKASRNAVKLEPDGRVRVALTAPPVDGAANKALRVFLAKMLQIPRRDVELVNGERARDKVLHIRGLSEREVSSKLFGI
jgi:uncharacterized protein